MAGESIESSISISASSSGFTAWKRGSSCPAATAQRATTRASGRSVANWPMQPRNRPRRRSVTNAPPGRDRVSFEGKSSNALLCVAARVSARRAISSNKRFSRVARCASQSRQMTLDLRELPSDACQYECPREPWEGSNVRRRMTPLSISRGERLVAFLQV